MSEESNKEEDNKREYFTWKSRPFNGEERFEEKTRALEFVPQRVRRISRAATSSSRGRPRVRSWDPVRPYASEDDAAEQKLIKQCPLQIKKICVHLHETLISARTLTTAAQRHLDKYVETQNSKDLMNTLRNLLLAIQFQGQLNGLLIVTPSVDAWARQKPLQQLLQICGKMLGDMKSESTAVQRILLEFLNQHQLQPPVE